MYVYIIVLCICTYSTVRPLFIGGGSFRVVHFLTTWFFTTWKQTPDRTLQEVVEIQVVDFEIWKLRIISCIWKVACCQLYRRMPETLSSNGRARYCLQQDQAFQWCPIVFRPCASSTALIGITQGKLMKKDFKWQIWSSCTQNHDADQGL